MTTRRPSAPLSEQRKKRDAAIRSIDERIAEHLEQARATGELQSAESYGKPLVEMAGYAQTPEEFRLSFKILKNAEVPPPEIALFHQRATLRQQLAQCATEPERVAVMKKLSELEQLIALRLEHMRRSGSV